MRAEKEQLLDQKLKDQEIIEEKSKKLENLFKLSKNNTSVKTEMIAGLATFLTMAYIIVVNPAILSTEGTGMDFGGVFVRGRKP